jgi:hypothetical protein
MKTNTIGMKEYNSERQVIMFSSSGFREIPNLIFNTSCENETTKVWDLNLRFGRFDLVNLPLEGVPCRRVSGGSWRHLPAVNTRSDAVSETSGPYKVGGRHDERGTKTKQVEISRGFSGVEKMENAA